MLRRTACFMREPPLGNIPQDDASGHFSERLPEFAVHPDDVDQRGDERHEKAHQAKRSGNRGAEGRKLQQSERHQKQTVDDPSADAEPERCVFLADCRDGPSQNVPAQVCQQSHRLLVGHRRFAQLIELFL